METSMSEAATQSLCGMDQHQDRPTVLKITDGEI